MCATLAVDRTSNSITLASTISARAFHLAPMATWVRAAPPSTLPHSCFIIQVIREHSLKWKTIKRRVLGHFVNWHNLIEDPFYQKELPARRGPKPVSDLLGLVPLNPIVWCYVCYYVWHYVWLNVVINKVCLLLLSKIMVTWIFGHYHIVHEMHSMWFMWFSHRRYRSQVLRKLIILVHSRWWN